MKKRILLFALVCLGACPTAWAGPSEDPTAVLLDQVAAQLAVHRSQVSVILLEVPNWGGPLSAYRFEFGSIPRGRTIVRGLSAEHKNITFTIDVRVWDSAWVATSRVERGGALAPEQFSRSWLDVTDLVIQSSGELKGLRARRNLIPGTVLVSDAVEPLPLIARGRAVTLAATSGHLKVSRQGVALTDARLGETIRVRVDGNTIISATAAGPDLCVVGF